MTGDREAPGRVRKVGLYVGLVREPRPDDGLSYGRRLRATLRSQWLYYLWFGVVITLSDSVRWDVTLLVAVVLGLVFLVIAALWQKRQERRNGLVGPPDGGRG